MATEQVSSDTAEHRATTSLAERILEELHARPGRRASELARILGIERREVNRCLSQTLAGRVVQDASYRWRRREDVAQSARPGGRRGPSSELGRLCRYYLECIGQDFGRGVSVPAASRDNEPGYAELPALPMTDSDGRWWSAPGIQRLLSEVKADRAKLQAWLGYPVRLRRGHRTARPHGFSVDPVMLWPVTLPQSAGDPYGIADDVPLANFVVLRSLAMGDASAIAEEAARLDEELGLNTAPDERPEIDELIQRLVTIRPDWDWQEPIDPYKCSQGASLAAIGQPGIYNRAVILSAERSPYTQGLEAELEKLGDADERALIGTALGHWLNADIADAGQPDIADDGQRDNEPLIEVLPMNTEQREAVRSALTASHTVVTGPPGTGKSQVVTNILVNAAWRGMNVLFASKNNKAVDVVEARINGLGNRPVLLRLGSGEYQTRLANYLTAMLSGRVSEHDRASYEEALAHHRQLAEKLAGLERIQQKTLEARNQVDRLEADVESYRSIFEAERFNDIHERLLSAAAALVPKIETAIRRLNPTNLGLGGRIALKLGRRARLADLQALASQLEPAAAHLGCEAWDVSVGPDDTAAICEWLKRVRERIAAAQKVLTYQNALDALRSSPSFEHIAWQRQKLTAAIADNSARLWRSWVELAPGRLTAAQRKDVANYAALLKVISAPNSGPATAAAKTGAKALQAKISAFFSCWAVTSLSARGRVPFEPGHFDLLIIDEASQCDIASALPLLFRAKRTVMIGDSKQLRHISAVTRNKDAELQTRYGLVENRAAWMYSVNSLYDLAAAVVRPEHLIDLRDHHRSHADIIGFSNRKFYEDKLRVATRSAHLKRPAGVTAGVIWQDTTGRVTRPDGSSAQNEAEARVLVKALHDLLVTGHYDGTVGVVTPFRAQVNLIQRMVAADSALSEVGVRSDLLIDTVHRFQGDERDVMFFSPVVSDGTPSSALGFLRSNGNLFNVAITRARGLLHVLGDCAAALDSGVDYLADFATYASAIASQDATGQVVNELHLGPEYPVVSRPEHVSEWERIFYRALYTAGVRAIPQYSVEQYDLDFAVIVGERRLNIEVDGERYHRSWTGELCLRDQLRNQRLIELGWEVKRFWVYEVRDRLSECVRWVQKWMAAGDGT